MQQNTELKATLQSREEDIGLAENGIERLGMREDRLLQELELLKRENSLLQEKNEQLTLHLHSSVFDKQTESYLILENENLREDVVRLIKMLQNTKEVRSKLSQYKNFADFADASGSIHYLKSIGKFSRLDLAERFKDLKNVPECKNHELFVDEKMLWVPAAAFKFAHDFRIKYDGRLTENLIEHLLYELNKIWCQREKRIASQIKSEYNSEAEILRRKIANTPSLELNHLQSEIRRLKQDLKNAYKDNQSMHANRQDLNPAGFHYIKGAMKMANEYTTNKNQLEKQNKYYKEVSEAYQKILNEDYKGNIYLAEGGKIATHKSSQLAHSMKNEIIGLLKEFESKASCIGGGSKEDLLKADQNREHFTTLVRRKLDQYCGQVGKEHKMANYNFAQTKDRIYTKK